jgi:hypothetical protein
MTPPSMPEQAAVEWLYFVMTYDDHILQLRRFLE